MESTIIHPTLFNDRERPLSQFSVASLKFKLYPHHVTENKLTAKIVWTEISFIKNLEKRQISTIKQLNKFNCKWKTNYTLAMLQGGENTLYLDQNLAFSLSAHMYVLVLNWKLHTNKPQ